MDLRLAPKATVLLKLNLNAGVLVPQGSFVSASSTNEQFRTLASISNTGTVANNFFVRAESLLTTPSSTKVGEITTIVSAISGWNSVTNEKAPIQPGDLDLSTGGLILTSGADEIAQNLRIRFKFFRGEWFLNPNVGVPFFEQILVKNPNLDVVRFIFTKAAEDIPKVDRVSRLELELDKPSRTMTVGIDVETDLGETLAFEETLIFENLT